MTTLTTTSPTGPFVLVGSENGITVIPSQTPLARLNYFDGKFLRAADLNAEQLYLRSLVELSNRAGGHGIAHGFDVGLRAQGQLEIAPGLAIDPQGRVLLLPAPATVGLAELIEKTRQSVPLATTLPGFGATAFGDCVAVKDAPPSQVQGTGDLYVITIAHAEALCGEEDVYGKLCEEACITSTDRPLRIEGIVLRARPLLLSVPLPTSGLGLTLTHWRSRVASSYFEEERRRVASLISKAGLESDVWCHGAVPESGTEVPIAVVGRVGTAIQFLDLWTVRRERIDSPARRYWQWRMAMRPWDVFLAHILQFQCQLNAVLGQTPCGGTPDDPCRRAQALIDEASTHFETLRSFYAETTQRLARLPRNVRERALAETSLSKASLAKLTDFGTRLTQATEAFKALPADRLLINGGIVELPSAGYLPVIPGATLTVNQQVRRMLGEGVDLRFCIVRPDYVAHALEEAQHLERISLITGIDNPGQKQEVDILVPNGQIAPDRIDQGRFYEMRLNVNYANLAILAAAFAALKPVAATPAATAATAAAAAEAEIAATPTIGTAAGAGPTAGTANRLDTAATTQLTLVREYLALAEREAKGSLVLEYPAGAARAESTPAGALAFCFAGSTGAFQLGDTPAATPADATPAELDRVGNRLESLPIGILNRSTRAVARNQIEARSSIWISLDLAGDPTELAAGDSVTARAECYLLLTIALKAAAGATRTTEELLLHLAFTGDLQVEDSDRRTGKSEVLEIKAVLSGRITFSTISTQDERESGSLHLTESLTIVRTDAANGPSYRIEVPEPSILQPLVAAFGVRRDWSSATQAEVIGSLAFRTARQRLDTLDREAFLKASLRVGNGLAPLSAAFQKSLGMSFAGGKLVNRQAFRAWQTIRPEVLDPTHPAHESAIGAVRGIGSALGSAKFADLAAKRLFPAPTPSAAGLNILATLDWVLFHRRRDKRCQADKPAPPVQTRMYALYQAQLPGDFRVADLARALSRPGTDLGRFELNFVQNVEFGPGIHALVSPHSQVQASWRQDVGVDAGRIEGGLIASRGLAAAEGERLAQDRLEAAVEVVAPVTPPVLQPEFLVLPRVPDGFVVAGNDGILVIATRRELPTNCHFVVGIDSAQWIPDLMAAVAAGGLAGFLSKIRQDLGPITFTGPVPDGTPLPALKAKWEALGFGKATGAVVVSVTGDARAADFALQAKTLLDGVDGSGEVVPAVAPQATDVGECPAVTIITGTALRRNALLIYTNWDNPDKHPIDRTAPVLRSSLQFLNDVPQGNALKNFIASLGPNRPVRGVTVAPPSAPPDSGAATRLAAVVKAALDGGKGPIAATRQVTQTLNAHDRAELGAVAIDPDGFDEIIFLEINAD